MAPEFIEFDQMIKEKYGVEDGQIENMSFKERDEKLRAMLADETIVVFPDQRKAAADEMPLFAVLCDDAKRVETEQDRNTRPGKKQYGRTPKVDMGVPPPKPGEEKQARAGSTFDAN